MLFTALSPFAVFAAAFEFRLLCFSELPKQLPAPVNGVKQPDGSLKSLSPRQAAELLGHSTSEITELYYVKKDTARLNGITNGFEL